MKKSYVLILFFFLLLIASINCKGNFNVSPRELSIKMEDELISDNTSKKIIISNNIDENINISWYIDNPSLDLIRENKTPIPSLSWISIEPEWKIIPPNGSSNFYIYLKIPNEKENYNKNWETWPVFKQEESQLFNFEHAIRLYIDTPETYNINEKEDSNFLSDNFLFMVIIAIFIIAVAILIFFKYQT